jgi:hypothetical protein
VARWDWVEPRHGVVRQKNNSTFFLRRLFLPRRQLPIARFAVVAASIAAHGFLFAKGAWRVSFALCWFDEYNLYLPVKPCSGAEGMVCNPFGCRDKFDKTKPFPVRGRPDHQVGAGLRDKQIPHSRSFSTERQASRVSGGTMIMPTPPQRSPPPEPVSSQWSA